LVQACSSPSQVQHKDTRIKPYLDSQQVEELSIHLARLSSDEMAGRKFSSVASKEAQYYIISSLIEDNVKPFKGKFRHPFVRKSIFSNKSGTNIIGYVEGNTFPNQYIVISAHYDHLGKKGKKIYNGADDNASGTAALLAFSQLIAKNPLKNSVIFLFTDGEELNLSGAKSFIKQQKLLLPQIRLNINIDMIAGSKSTSKLHFIDNRLEEILSADNITRLKTLAKQLSIKLKRGFKRDSTNNYKRVNWINASDHGPFNYNHIPFIYFGVGVHQNYHTPDDTYENLNLPFYIQACQSIFHYISFFDQNIMTSQKKT